MRREVSRTRRLPAFRLDLQELGLLWSRCIALFDPDLGARSFLSVELPGERLIFNSFDELASCQDLPRQFTTFTLRIHGDDEYVALAASRLASGRPEVTASGGSEAWCAGAIETVASFVKGHRAWYGWLVVAPLGLLSFLAVFVFPIAAALYKDYTKASPVDVPLAAWFGWACLAIATVLVWVSRGRFFPSAAVIVREPAGYLRRYVGELSLLVAVISAVLSVVGWFVSR